MRLFLFLILSAASAFSETVTNFANIGNFPTNIAYGSNYLLGVTYRGSNGATKLFSVDDILGQSGGGGGSASNAVTKVNDLTNALQYIVFRTNSTTVPTVNTNGVGSKATNFLDISFAGNAVSGIQHSNDYRRLNGVWAEAQGVQSAVYGTNSNVAGGSNNVVYGLESVISGGGGNMIQTNRHSAIAGGNHNAIWGNTDPDRASFIGAGEYNIITNSSAHSAIPAGLSNVIDNARYSFLGAWKSKIQGKQANGASNAAIASGWINTNEVKNSVIAGGYFNAIQYTNRLVDPDADQEGNFIGAGWNNTIRGGYGSAIVGGYSNQIVQLGAVGDQRQSSSFIGAGIQCKITGGSFYSAIADGVGNLIDGSSSGSFIGGGFNNRINGGSTGYIIGGSQNTNSGSNSLIGGGNFNTIGVGDSSAILSGFYNYLYAQESFIIGSHLTNDFTAGGSDFRIDMGYSEATKVTIDAASLTARGTLKGTGGADISGGITNGALTANRFVLADANKKLVSSANAVTDTEFGYLSGLSSSIQNQLAAKQTGSATLSNMVNGLFPPNTNTTEVVSNWVRLPAATSGFTEIARPLAAVAQSNSFTFNVVNPAAGQVLTIDSVSFSAGTNNVAVTNKAVAGTGDVTAAATFGTDNRVIRSDGTGKGVQSSGVTLDDSDNITIPGTVTVTGIGTFNGAATFTANVNLQKNLDVLDGSLIKLGSQTWHSNHVTMYSNVYVGGGLTVTNGNTNYGPIIAYGPAPGTTAGSVRINGTNNGSGTGFYELTVPLVGQSNSVVHWPTSVSAGQILGFVQSVTVQAGTNSIASTNASFASGWGSQLAVSANAGTITAYATNALALMATNATTYQADFTGGSSLVQTADFMRTNVTLQITNPIVGRQMTLHFRGDGNAVDRTVTVSTNGMTGNWPISWGWNSPTNGATAFTVTNNIGAELSMLVLSNRISAFWQPVR